MTSSARKRVHDASAREEGFTLIELIIAMMVIATVLLLLMAVQTSALVTTTQTRQRTQATAVGNQVMEQLRALPWMTLEKGTHINFVSASGGDPNIVAGKLRPASDPSINETIISSNAQAQDVLPLSGALGTNKTVEVDAAVPGRTFTSRVYVTKAADTADGVLTLTVITTWSNSGNGKPGTLMLRSEAYAPMGGCGDAANQPFLGACQAIFSSSGGTAGPTTTITGAVPGATTPAAPGAGGALPILPGSDVFAATMAQGQAGVGVSSQQAAAVDSIVTHAGTRLLGEDPDVDLGSSGQTKIANAASNDVGASGAAPTNPADVVGIGLTSPLTVSSGPLSLALSATSGVSGMAKASTVTSCATGIPMAQPCGSATLSGGSASSATLTVSGTPFTVSALAGGGTSKTFGARFFGAAGSADVGCTVVLGAGCASAGGSRTVGTATFGAGPWTEAGAQPGLVSITGLKDSVRVERGSEQRTVTAVTSRTGSVSYWNGSSYSVQSLSALTNTTITVPPVTWSGAGFTVEAAATIIITPGMSIATNVDPVACTAEGCALDADSGSVTVALTYTVTSAAGQSSFVASTALGASRANAAYKAAPDA